MNFKSVGTEKEFDEMFLDGITGCAGRKFAKTGSIHDQNLARDFSMKPIVTPHDPQSDRFRIELGRIVDSTHSRMRLG